MKTNVLQTRSRLLALIVAGIAGTGIGVPAMAEEGAAAAQAGGVAEAHMSASGSANANAQWRNGATRGAERAERRMSSYGAEMKRSGPSGFDGAAHAAPQGKR